MAGRPRVDVDEDVPLVDNAAAASLLSPSVWVQRPSRTAGLAGNCLGEQDWPMRQRPESRHDDPMADPDLAYLQIKDDSAERERQQQDAEHLAGLEEAYVRLKEQNLALEAQLSGQVAGVKEVLEDNATIKTLLAALQVRKEDFMVNPQLPPEQQAAAMQAAGLRLIANLCQQQPPAGLAASCEQQQQQKGTDQRQQQQEQQQQQDEGPGQGTGGSPDLITPHHARAASPRIAAIHHSSQDTQQQPQQPGEQQLEPASLFSGQGTQPRVPPSSPYDFPAEAQIAAAALTMTGGDPTEALVTLLDKAMAGRRHHHAQAHLPAGM